MFGWFALAAVIGILGIYYGYRCWQEIRIKYLEWITLGYAKRTLDQAHELERLLRAENVQMQGHLKLMQGHIEVQREIVRDLGGFWAWPKARSLNQEYRELPEIEKATWASCFENEMKGNA